MPVKIDSFEPLSDEEFERLRQQKKGRRTDPGMVDLLNSVAAGETVRVPLSEGQSARGLRIAIAKAASSRGLTVETVEGEGFVGVKRADEPRQRRPRQPAAGDGQRRRGRPPKRQEQDETEITSLQDLALGEA